MCLLPSLVIAEHMFLEVFGFLTTWHSKVLGTELSSFSSLVNIHLLAPQWKFQMPCLFLVLLVHLQDDYSLLRHVLDPTGPTARGLYWFRFFSSEISSWVRQTITNLRADVSYFLPQAEKGRLRNGVANRVPISCCFSGIRGKCFYWLLDNSHC